jgi:hypothetical protein
LRLYALSDVHADYRDNLGWLEALPDYRARTDDARLLHPAVLLLAGDVSHDLRIVRRAVALLRERFDRVVALNGNHELWVHKRGAAEMEGGGASLSSSSSWSWSSSSAEEEAPPDDDDDEQQRRLVHGGARDSPAKAAAALEAARQAGALTAPCRAGAAWIVPVSSWHSASFDREPDPPEVPRSLARFAIADYRACEWPRRVVGGEEGGGGGDEEQEAIPPGSDAVMRWADAQNDAPSSSSFSSSSSSLPWDAMLRGLARAREGGTGASAPFVAAFSHFLPSQRLLPEKRFLSVPPLAKAVGSDMLAERLRRGSLRPDVAIFGHTHFAWDATMALEDEEEEEEEKRQAPPHKTRFLQAPLCYPSERRRRGRSLQADLDAQIAWARRWASSCSGGGGDDDDWEARDAEARRAEAATAEDAVAAWLPLCFYRAEWEAELGEMLEEEEDEDDGLEELLCYAGLPVVLRAGAAAPSAFAPASRPCYRLTRWRGEQCPPLRALWSTYYEENARDPTNVELAPWVKGRYERRAARLAKEAAEAAASAG